MVSASFSTSTRSALCARQFGIEPAGVGDIGDQPVEAPHVVLDDGVEPLAILGALGQRQGFDGRAQRGQRVLELMRHVGGEALDGLDAVVERRRSSAQRAAADGRSRRGGRRNRGFRRGIAGRSAPARRPPTAAAAARQWCRRAAATGRSAPPRRPARCAGCPSARRDDLVDVARAVDSSSTPTVARRRCTGTATETTSWCLRIDAHESAGGAGQRRRDLGIAGAFVDADIPGIAGNRRPAPSSAACSTSRTGRSRADPAGSMICRSTSPRA